MKPLRHVACILLLLTEASCALLLSKETRFLHSAENHATQVEVQQQLGQPVRMLSTQMEESVWVYHVLDLEPGAQVRGRLQAPGVTSMCCSSTAKASSAGGHSNRNATAEKICRRIVVSCSHNKE
ncbi:MAG: hypothetical protein ABI945_05050 [Nitrospirales bacterium]